MQEINFTAASVEVALKAIVQLFGKYLLILLAKS